MRECGRLSAQRLGMTVARLDTVRLDTFAVFWGCYNQAVARLSMTQGSPTPQTTSSASGVSRMRDEWLIYAVIALALASVYGGSFAASPDLRSPAGLIPLTALMVAHAG